MASEIRARREAEFNEWLRALIDFARHEGESGARESHTRDATKALRVLYRTALNDAEEN
jgi:hypothetical protein